MDTGGGESMKREKVMSVIMRGTELQPALVLALLALEFIKTVRFEVLYSLPLKYEALYIQNEPFL